MLVEMFSCGNSWAQEGSELDTPELRPYPSYYFAARWWIIISSKMTTEHCEPDEKARTEVAAIFRRRLTARQTEPPIALSPVPLPFPDRGAAKQ